MFDRDHSGTIDLGEFQALWNYIHQWKGVFDQFDRDRSGAIESTELQNGWFIFILVHAWITMIQYTILQHYLQINNSTGRSTCMMYIVTCVQQACIHVKPLISHM